MGEEEKDKGGRPTKYQYEFADQAYKLCLLGHTDVELAKFFEVNEDTIYEWKKNNAEFSEALKRGKDIADSEVANSFHKRAIGYQYDEVTFEKIDLKIDGVQDEDDVKTEAYKRKVVTKEVAPDASAALSWLKNRQPAKWRDKQEVDHTIKQQTPLTPEQVKKLNDDLESKY